MFKFTERKFSGGFKPVSIFGMGKIAALCCVAASAAHGAPILVTSLGALGATDSAGWAQLGGDLTTLGASFSADGIAIDRRVAPAE